MKNGVFSRSLFGARLDALLFGDESWWPSFKAMLGVVVLLNTCSKRDGQRATEAIGSCRVLDLDT